MQQFIESLRHDLLAPLPGSIAQYQMAPQPRSGRLPYDQAPDTARRSGVLILFYPQEDAQGQEEIYLPLILRPTYDGVHSGQIGLPGGRWEDTDVDIVATALRETHEEIGVHAEHIEVLGQLSPLYVFASNNLVYPTVGWIDHRPTFEPDPYEVALLLEFSLRDLLDPGNLRSEQWQLRDRAAQVPFYYIQKQTIWGATAMILSELLTLPTVAQLVERST
jgi:8-oxo-dGTP pyrophosphatase MutT (NUDIX family)